MSSSGKHFLLHPQLSFQLECCSVRHDVWSCSHHLATLRHKLSTKSQHRQIQEERKKPRPPLTGLATDQAHSTDLQMSDYLKVTFWSFKLQVFGLLAHSALCIPSDRKPSTNPQSHSHLSMPWTLESWRLALCLTNLCGPQESQIIAFSGSQLPWH